MTTIGIDVSAVQGHIDWIRVARWVGALGERVEFAICKCSQGNTIADPQFLANWSGIGAVGLLRGAYHFADPDTVHASDAEEEARWFCSRLIAAGFVPGEDFAALDIEEARKIHAGPDFAEWVRVFVVTVEAVTGAAPLVYTGGPFWNAETDGATVDAAVTRCPLWLAAYVKASVLDHYVPRSWSDWLLWQRSGDQAASDCSILHVDGIQGNVDRDVFRGSIDDMRLEIRRCVVTLTDPAPAPDGASAHALALDHVRDVEDEAAALADTIPETPTGKSGQIPAVVPNDGTARGNGK